LGKSFAQVPLSPSTIIWHRSQPVMAYNWKGNRRFGIALAMHHRLEWFNYLQAQGLS